MLHDMLTFVAPVPAAPVQPLQPARHETGSSALGAGPVAASLEPGFQEEIASPWE
jgi:hypothetical protein